MRTKDQFIKRRSRLWSSVCALILGCGLLAPQMGGQCRNSAPQVETETGGRIFGTVLDPEGTCRIAGARVYAFYDGPQGGLVTDTLTSDDGTFVLKNVTPGPNWVVADKESEGYPDPVNGMYGYEWWTLPKVMVQDRKSIGGVTARLFPKVGKLAIRVLDAATELPLKGGCWRVSRNDDRELSMGGSSKFPEDGLILLVPPTPCRVEVSADGYEPWYYGGDGSKEAASALVIPAGEAKELMVFLHPHCGAQRQPTNDH